MSLLCRLVLLLPLLLISTGRSQICSLTDVVNQVVGRRLSVVLESLVSRSASLRHTSVLWSSKSGHAPLGARVVATDRHLLAG